MGLSVVGLRVVGLRVVGLRVGELRAEESRVGRVRGKSKGGGWMTSPHVYAGKTRQLLVNNK